MSFFSTITWIEYKYSPLAMTPCKYLLRNLRLHHKPYHPKLSYCPSSKIFFIPSCHLLNEITTHPLVQIKNMNIISYFSPHSVSKTHLLLFILTVSTLVQAIVIYSQINAIAPERSHASDVWCVWSILHTGSRVIFLEHTPLLHILLADT